MSQILAIVLPVFLVIGAGFLLRKYGLVGEAWVHVLNSFVYYVSLPAIILISFWQIKWTEPGLFKLFLVNVVILVLFTLLLLLVLPLMRLSRPLQAAIIMTSLVGNTIYMGFPILGPVLNGDYLGGIIGNATLHLVIGIVISIMVAEYLVNRSGKLRNYLFDFLTNPLMIALGLGIILSFISLPSWIATVVSKPVSMLAATASPVALFALGAFMHGKFDRPHFNLSLLASVLKLAAFPLFAWALAALFGLGHVGGQISALTATMPAAATTFVIADQQNLSRTFVGTTIILSTILSLFSIVAFLAFLT
ncbi:MAG: AEC family transporter [Acidobacteriaceae bacterium]